MLSTCLAFVRRFWPAVAVVLGALVLTGAVWLDSQKVVVNLTQPGVDKATEAAADPTTNPVPTMDWKAADELKQMNDWRNQYPSGYDCPFNNNVTNVKQLRLCPDYKVIVKMNGKNKPTVTMQPATANKAITTDLKFYRSCGNDGVKGVPVTCSDYWSLKWHVNAPYVALGSNQQMRWKLNDTTSWTGPLGFGWDNDQELLDNDTVSYEIYAGDPGHVASEPLTAEKDYNS